jgi:hypothetical protein
MSYGSCGRALLLGACFLALVAPADGAGRQIGIRSVPRMRR